MVRSEYKRRHESFGRSISHSGSQEGKEIGGHTCRILVTEEAPTKTWPLALSSPRRKKKPESEAEKRRRIAAEGKGEKKKEGAHSWRPALEVQ